MPGVCPRFAGRKSCNRRLAQSDCRYRPRHDSRARTVLRNFSLHPYRYGRTNGRNPDRDRNCDTPSDLAASVTVKFRGSRQSCLSTSPGCGGLCIFMVTSMVVLVVHPIYVLLYKSKGYAPVAAHSHGPCAFSGSAKLVKVQAGQIHIARAG